jgi:hypothetical protein
MQHLLPAMIGLLTKYDSNVLFKPKYFDRQLSKAVNREFVKVKPIARWADNVELGFHIGNRTNGVDKARWPEDLRTEIVT